MFPGATEAERIKLMSGARSLKVFVYSRITPGIFLQKISVVSLLMVVLASILLPVLFQVGGSGGSCLALDTRGPAQPRTKLKLFGQVDQFAMMCMAAGISLDDVKLPSRITRVKPGSPAFYGGVNEGDDVISATPGTDSLILQIERKGRRYLANIPINMEALRLRLALMEKLRNKVESQSRTASSNASPPQADSQLKALKPYEAKLDVQRFYRAMAPYKLVVLVDR